MSNTAEHEQPLVAGQEPPSNLVGEELSIDSSVSSIHAPDDNAGYSSTASLSSSVTTFRMEYGRRYHAFDDDAYWLPNDEEEMARLDLQHIVWSISLNGRLFLAPLPTEMERALDLGTGTGKWAIEFADKHPAVQVIGTDLSPIQPTTVPPNCCFIVDNIEDEWVFRESFDYIHGRMLLLGQFVMATFTRLSLRSWNCEQHGAY
jgi:Methyltransferase domain